ncbi:MAG: tRNA uracil 4-sulfurtransferase ThiI [Mariprofundales bacterium]|nr:tRNA uracil 4-sulfurtransferase ThiI [Mariprofundales bacterium]
MTTSLPTSPTVSTTILIHYGEIALKGGNRRWFENRLLATIKELTGAKMVERQYGRMLIALDHVDDGVLDHLALIPGIRNFAVVQRCAPELHAMQELGLAMVTERYGEQLQGRPFRVSSRRSDKRFALTSPEINMEVGGFLKQTLGMRVDLDHPEIHLQIELSADGAYLMVDKRRGIGGLPVGSSGTGVVLLSGGIDSPVAAYLMMKRGMSVVLVHCYNSTLNRDLSKIRRLVQQLTRYGGRLRLCLVDMEEYQRHAIAMVPAKYRMILYKRQMIRSANTIAATHKAQAVVTGDSLGQVASQTLHNISAIYSASQYPLLSPLIASDKEEIIALARRIGSYEISIEEYCDICSYLIAKHPETHAQEERVAHYESLLPLDSIHSPVIEEQVGRSAVEG